MEPVYGRFSALNHSKGGLVFARILQDPAVEVLLSNRAYRSSPITAAHASSCTVIGNEGLPSTKLIALLLAIPSTTCTLDDENLENGYSQPNRSAAKLQLSCTDAAGLQLVVTFKMVQIPAESVLAEVHESLFSAIVALEATLRDAGGEKNLNFLGQGKTESMSLATVKEQFLPLMTMGQLVQDQPVFRKAAGADARVQASRAFVIANASSKVRGTILEKIRIRKEEEERRKRAERERLKEAMRISKLAKARRENPQAVAKRPKRSLFDTDRDEEKHEKKRKSPDAMPSRNPKPRPLHEKRMKEKEPRYGDEFGDIVAARPKPQRREERAQAMPAEMKDTAAPAPEPEQITQSPVNSAPIPSRKKKKRKLRALV